MYPHLSRSTEQSPKHAVSPKTKKISLKPLCLDLANKDPVSPLAALKLHGNYGPTSSTSPGSNQLKSLKCLLPVSKTPTTTTSVTEERKASKSIHNRSAFNINFSEETRPQRLARFSQKMSSTDDTQEVFESCPNSKDDSRIKIPVTTWAEVSATKEDRANHFMKKAKSHERFKNNSDVQEIQKRLAMIFDKSKEKIKVQKSQSISLNPKNIELQKISQELNDLRRITQDLTLRNNSEKHRDSVACLSCLRRSEPNSTSVSPSASKRNSMYYMSPDYKPAVRFGNTDNNLSKSKTNLLGGFSELPQTNETSQTLLGLDSTPAIGSRFKDKRQTSDLFDKMVMFRNKKMPFSLALTAKTRQRLFEELKQRKFIDQNNVSNPDAFVELRNQLVPEERAKFLGKLDEEKKQKKYDEMRSKLAHSGAIYQIFGLSKASQRKVRTKIEAEFPPNSRFLDVFSNHGV